MPKSIKAWICPACAPPGPFEELTITAFTDVVCYNCGTRVEGKLATCMSREVYDKYVESLPDEEEAPMSGKDILFTKLTFDGDEVNIYLLTLRRTDALGSGGKSR